MKTHYQRGSPIQEVSPQRWKESPSRRYPRGTNSPQAGNEGDFGNINDGSISGKAIFICRIY